MGIDIALKSSKMHQTIYVGLRFISLDMSKLSRISIPFLNLTSMKKDQTYSHITFSYSFLGQTFSPLTNSCTSLNTFEMITKILKPQIRLKTLI